MNKVRRRRLRVAMERLGEVRMVVEAVCDEESDCLDNYPENLQESERYQNAETAVDSLNDASEKLDEVADGLNDILEKLDEAAECIQTAIDQ